VSGSRAGEEASSRRTLELANLLTDQVKELLRIIVRLLSSASPSGSGIGLLAGFASNQAV
jgi:hypothetical protein